MSLIYRLPLRDDLENYGLYEATATGHNLTTRTDGKIGKCQSFGKSMSLAALTNSSGAVITNSNGEPIEITSSGTTVTNSYIGIDKEIAGRLSGDFSFTLWLRIDQWATAYETYVYGGKGSSAWTDYIFGLLRNNTANSVVFVIGNGSSATNANCASGTLTAGKWYHVACTYTSGTMRLYIDGTLVKEYATTVSPDFSKVGVFNLGALNSVGTYQTNSSVNDFRLYGHCLSLMEVKELSKGLVLHYPLNRGGFGQENLMPGTYRADGSNTNKVYGWQANGYGTPEIVTKDGSECIHLQASCSNTTTPSIVSASKLLLENGIEYTISCDLMYDKEIKVTNSTPVHYHNGSTDSTDPFNLTNVNNGKGFSWKSIKPVTGTIVPANTWQHYEMHLTALATPSDSSLPYSTYRAFIYGSVRTVSETATVNMWLKNWKIEKGAVATPWIPNSADTLYTTMGLNGTTEYDCSGFCNNGTRTGVFDWTSDTPKYGVSQYFNGSSYIKTLPGEFPWSNYDNLTIAAWMKPTTTPSSWTGSIGIANDASSYTNKAVAISNYGGKFSIHIPNGSSWGTTQSTYTIPLNTWHHCVATISGTTVNMYVDGVLNKTFTADFGTATNHANPQIEVGVDLPGADEIYTGYYSDCRIYATALSATDVLSLYQNSAYIDNSGNVYGAVHSEV